MLSCKAICRRVPDVRVLICRGVTKNHYDALGLTPKATQTDIKNAYYKMSMVFHPDKAKGNSAKFQEIGMAYEVLSNNKLRKLYDKGLLPMGASKYAEAQEKSKSSTDNDWTAKRSRSSTGQYQQQEKRPPNFNENVRDKPKVNPFDARSRTYTGRTEHYDYDAWTQAHYSETFAKQEFRKDERLRRENIKMRKAERMERIISIAFIFLAGSAIYSGITIRNWDNTPRYR